MILWLAGDIHGKTEHITAALEASTRKPRCLILLGDLELPTPLVFEKFIRSTELMGVMLFWIIGNHDTDTDANLRGIASDFAQQRRIDGRVVDIEGFLVAGLGGIFRGEVWSGHNKPSEYDNYANYANELRKKQGLKRRFNKQDLIRAQAVPGTATDHAMLDNSRDGKLRKHLSSIFYDTYLAVAAQKAHLLVTHEAPQAHPFGFPEIDQLAQATDARWSFHGHHHDNLRYPPMAGGCQPYGVGLSGISALDTVTGEVTVIVPGEDDARRYHLRQERVDRG